MAQIVVLGFDVPMSLELDRSLCSATTSCWSWTPRTVTCESSGPRRVDLIVMPPADLESSHRSRENAARLTGGESMRGSGLAFDSSGGFVLPSGAMRAPDARWIDPELAGSR